MELIKLEEPVLVFDIVVQSREEKKNEDWNPLSLFCDSNC